MKQVIYVMLLENNHLLGGNYLALYKSSLSVIIYSLIL